MFELRFLCLQGKHCIDRVISPTLLEDPESALHLAPVPTAASVAGRLDALSLSEVFLYLSYLLCIFLLSVRRPFLGKFFPTHEPNHTLNIATLKKQTLIDSYSQDAGFGDRLSGFRFCRLTVCVTLGEMP